MRPLLCALLVLAACRPDTLASPDLGAACRSTGDCTTRCLPAPRWPGGFCSRDCMRDADCPADGVCAMTQDDGAACLFSCRDDRDCAFLITIEGTSWKCAPVAQKLVCIGE